MTESADEFTVAWESVGVAALRIVDAVAIAYELAQTTESPIETILGVSLTQSCLAFPGLQLIPQYKWQRYRIDWVLMWRGAAQPCVFIECDGKEFHTSDLQIARDRKRDAESEAAGFTVLRFTGANIYRSADACARLCIASALARRQ